jgi:hypothetical protein
MSVGKTVLGLGCGALAGVVALNMLSGPSPEQAKLDLQRQQLQLQQQRQQAQRDEANAEADARWDWSRPATWLRLGEILLIASVSLGVPATGLVVVHRLWSRRHMPNDYGMVPLPNLSSEEALRVHAMAMQVMAIRAANPETPVLQTLHTTNAPRLTGAPVAPAAVVEAPQLTISGGPEVPRYGELISAGEVGGQRRLLWGYSADGELRHTRDEEVSAGFAGLPNFGKSNSAAGVVIQHVLRGAGLALIDPQAGNDRSLATRLGPLEEAGAFLVPTAVSPTEIRDTVKLFHDELLARQERQATWRREHGLSVPAPRERLIGVAIDEWRQVIAGPGGAEMVGWLENILAAGPKMGVIALLIAQRWDVEGTGGGSIRNLLPATLIHRSRQDDARMVSGLRGDAIPEAVAELGPGQAYLVAPGVVPVLVGVPLLEQADITEVANRVRAAREAVVLGTAPENRSGTALGTAPGGSWTAPAGPWGDRSEDRSSDRSVFESSLRSGSGGPSPEAERATVLELLQQGATVPAIVERVYGVGRSRGTKYAEATVRVMAILRDAARPPLVVLDGEQRPEILEAEPVEDDA